MKKLFVVFLLLFIAFPVVADIDPFTVGVWVNTGKDHYDNRVINELDILFKNSDNFYFKRVTENTNRANFHVVISGLVIEGKGMSWGVGITPIQDPAFTNAFAFWSDASISGANWTARQIMIKLEEMVYIMYDYYLKMEEAEENNSGINEAL